MPYFSPLHNKCGNLRAVGCFKFDHYKVWSHSGAIIDHIRACYTNSSYLQGRLEGEEIQKIWKHIAKIFEIDREKKMWQG